MSAKSKRILIWAALCAAVLLPFGLAVNSPLLQWRNMPYIIAGLAGVLSLAVLLLQPLLAGRYLPGLSPAQNIRFHWLAGSALIVLVITHVLGLWVSSPPDVIDVLLFRSPTPFSNWGVAAMWAVFCSGLLVLTRGKLWLKPRLWKVLHLFLASIIVFGTIIHALLIEGTMETVSKTGLCALVALAFLKTVLDRRKS